MCNTDYDPADFYFESIVKARKEHKCTECHRIIRKEEKYKRTVGKWEGDVSTFKTCSHCQVPQQWLLKECNGFLHQGLNEEITEHAHDYQKMFLWRWVVGIRRQWKYLKSNKLMPIPSIENKLLGVNHGQ